MDLATRASRFTARREAVAALHVEQQHGVILHEQHGVAARDLGIVEHDTVVGGSADTHVAGQFDGSLDAAWPTDAQSVRHARTRELPLLRDIGMIPFLVASVADLGLTSWVALRRHSW